MSDRESEHGFLSRHIGPDERDVAAMLREVGAESLEDLVERVVPSELRQGSDAMALDPALSEHKMLTRASELANMNQTHRSLLGLGYHDTITPAAIKRHILENPGWYTQYTPYQPEISQGRLEALLNFQTMVSDLTGLPVANASLLDEPTASAEAMSLANGLRNRDGSKAFFVDERCHPATIEVVCGRASAVGLNVIIGNCSTFDFNTAICGALVPYPTTTGQVLDLSEFSSRVRDNGGLLVVTCDLLALTLFKPPGEFGADIAVGSSQRFGVPMGFGGPHAAFFAVKEELKRQVPGRIVGVSKDRSGSPALRLALQTREQHIRRERATSNICTAQALLASMAGMYAVHHGPEGLRRIAERIHSLAVDLAATLKSQGNEIVHAHFFDTLCVRTVLDQKTVIRRALEQGINLRATEDGCLVVALDELSDEEECERLAQAFAHRKPVAKAKASKQCQMGAIPAHLARTSSFLKHEVFSRHRSETNLLRYIKRLESKDLSLTTSMIPLGSCTMKLNAACELAPVSWAGFAAIHPFAPSDQTAGYAQLFKELEHMLCEVTGFDAVSLQPNSGAQGEYAGLCAIRAFHTKNGQTHRDVCLIPSSAHGTNPASAIMAGFKVVVVKCDKSGNIDREDFCKKIDNYKEALGALMITYPSTHGVFEEGITEVCRAVHEAGGQVYLDGANLNAQVGICKPADYGADVCHMNLHKTFCIPHGGGGPGVGPIGVRAHLRPFLPGHKSTDVGGLDSQPAVSGAPWGSAGILPISWAYCKLMGERGLRRASQVAILNANYMASRLSEAFTILFRGRGGFVAHECIVDVRPFKASAGIEAADIAKRLMDYGFHAPTMSFPVVGTLMIEPTESEDRSEIDRFCDAMLSIREEIAKVESGEWDKSTNPLKMSPHSLRLALSDSWDRPYPRSVGFAPSKGAERSKFWPAVERIDEAFGDRNLICSCPPISEF